MPTWVDLEVARGVLMVAILLGAFTAMSCFNISQALAMPLVACSFIGLSPVGAHEILQAGFREFAVVAVLFTAVAVPAHMIERSGAFRWLGAGFGRHIGVISLRYPRAGTPLLVVSALVATYIAAALFHNITSILVMVPITIGLCSRYQVPSQWLLCGELVASNLGGFSTSWGDTPNIVESSVWQLSNVHFLVEVAPPNLVILGGLTAAVLILTINAMKTRSPWGDPFRVATEAAAFRSQKADMSVDRRLMLVGGLALGGFIVFQYIWRAYELTGAAVAILVATLGERPEHRLKTLQSLDLDLYMVLASIFVLANAVDDSWVGEMLKSLVRSTNGAPWAIAASSYFGTAFTEAASWASAVARATYGVNSSHAAAWALGGGICAGSSSLITAASAGIILSVESQRFRGHEISFGKYMPFGIIASALMLVFYAAYFTLLG